MRNVRNFWIVLDVDGRKTRIAAGPHAKTGGFRMRIHMREDGRVSDRSVFVEGRVYSDDRLELWIDGAPSGILFSRR